MKKISLILILGLAFLIGLVFLRQNSRGLSGELPTKVVVSSTPKPAEVVASVPKKLEIPKIGVSAPIESVGLDNKNFMDVPKVGSDAAWYNLGSKPGNIGNAVIAGHFDYTTGAPAIFYDLSKLSEGDEIIVTDETDKTFHFKVKKTASYQFDQLPLDEIFGDSQQYNINLITCDGTFDQGSKNYSKRLVVYAQKI